MRKCDEIQEFIGIYWDLPDNDIRRKHVDDHIKSCVLCEGEFLMWKESQSWIHSAKVDAEMKEKISSGPKESKVVHGVMDRIYSNESWKAPVPSRVYHFSYQLRRRLSILMAFCLALFVVSFVHSLFYDGTTYDAEQYDDFSGFMPVASAGDGESLESESSSSYESLQGIPVASISDPMVFRVRPVPSDPNYFLIVSILGMAATVLVMNWLSRTRN